MSVTPDPEEAKTADDFPHGTTKGYVRKCRSNCPGNAEGITCSQAHSAKQKEYAAARKLRAHGEPLPSKDDTPAIESVIEHIAEPQLANPEPAGELHHLPLSTAAAATADVEVESNSIQELLTLAQYEPEKLREHIESLTFAGLRELLTASSATITQLESLRNSAKSIGTELVSGF